MRAEAGEGRFRPVPPEPDVEECPEQEESQSEQRQAYPPEEHSDRSDQSSAFQTQRQTLGDPPCPE